MAALSGSPEEATMTTAPRPSVPLDVTAGVDYVLARIPQELPPRVGRAVAAMVQHGLDAVLGLPADEQTAAWTPNLDLLAQAWAANGERFEPALGDAQEREIAPAGPPSVAAYRKIGVCIWPFCP